MIKIQYPKFWMSELWSKTRDLVVITNIWSKSSILNFEGLNCNQKEGTNHHICSMAQNWSTNSSLLDFVKAVAHLQKVVLQYLICTCRGCTVINFLFFFPSVDNLFHPCRIIRTEIGWEIAWCWCYVSEVFSKEST